MQQGVTRVPSRAGQWCRSTALNTRWCRCHHPCRLLACAPTAPLQTEKTPAYLHVCARPPPLVRPFLLPVRFQDLWTPLHFAASNGHTEAIEVLLAAGAAQDQPAEV